MSDTADFAKQAEDMMKKAQEIAQPEQAQKLIKDGIDKSKEAYDKATLAIRSASKDYETVVATAQSGTQKLSEKAVANIKTNSDAVFEYASALADCNSPADAMELQTNFFKKQFDLLNQQTKEFFELSNEVTANVVEKAADAAKKASSK